MYRCFAPNQYSSPVLSVRSSSKLVALRKKVLYWLFHLNERWIENTVPALHTIYVLQLSLLARGLRPSLGHES